MVVIEESKTNMTKQEDRNNHVNLFLFPKKQTQIPWHFLAKPETLKSRAVAIFARLSSLIQDWAPMDPLFSSLCASAFAGEGKKTPVAKVISHAISEV